MKGKITQFFLLLSEVSVITGITLFALFPVSCKVSQEGIKVIGGDYVPPVLENFTVISDDCLKLTFSEKVHIDGSVVSKVDESAYSSMEHSETEDLSPALYEASGARGFLESTLDYSEDGKTVTVTLNEKTEIGDLYELYGKVKDEIGNSLTFAIPFTGFNSRIPEILMTEIQTESLSSQTKAEKNSSTYRNEFVEFLALSDGNLAGLEMISAYDGEQKKYEFPKIEVKKGEIFIVHMRNRGEGCISEEGDSLDEAFSGYTKNDVRDLWTDITSTTLGNKNDVLIVRNKANNQILDGVMFRESKNESWSKNLEPYAQLLQDSGIYEGNDVCYATIADDKSQSKTLSRKMAGEIRDKLLAGEVIEYPVKAFFDDWIVTKDNPGEL